MNLIEKCSHDEIKLIEQAGIMIENKEYSNEDLKQYEARIIDYIMSHSSKNGDISKLRNQYENIFSIINVK